MVGSMTLNCQGCSIVKYPSQDSTDCTKTLHHLIGLRNNGKFQVHCVHATDNEVFKCFLFIVFFSVYIEWNRGTI